MRAGQLVLLSSHPYFGQLTLPMCINNQFILTVITQHTYILKVFNVRSCILLQCQISENNNNYNDNLKD